MSTTTKDATVSTNETRYAVSADGTRIAYDVTGTGPALVLVDGALCQRSMGPARGLTTELSGQFTVHTYDRRGRGESDPGASTYIPEREIEDLAAVIDAAGGSAHVFSASSGAALALAAAAAGLPIERLVAYEAPFIVDDTHAPCDADLGERTRALVDADRRGEAVKLFMRLVGVPRPMLAVMSVLPVWKKLTGVAHTLPHDYAIVLRHQQGTPLPDGLYAASTTPTLVIAGGRSAEYMLNSQAAVAAAVPDGRLEVLPGQTHMIKAKVVAPVVARHLAG
ncbi:alpha/beta hydrolase [Nocardioides sp. InS609-2]|uniref:alpha/beta fold hydrolase n=1 Tax=Nocardioides sp. InS609-2 TaxID=2760705 RepID=UPI0020BF044C|nr:alpha/beta hydrolase [Nocardioides sp. InS609-2]